MPISSSVANARSASFHAVVTKADGSVVDYGVVAYRGRNFFKGLAFSAIRKLFPHHPDRGQRNWVIALQRRILGGS